ncbi:T9SS type A sorting domain-containing protein [Flavobacterium sp. F372]|uniref:T9SS type A sorting domain-containing protein n=1 Tax=Flavobacterium bernardetii TaxID=2813823 RepID=A0ABR7IYF6_9FLAO|nr:T9SS type A sorting domain-containing protein [Flavobacterium bernardetii]MBC5834810.1 T9SS type A sorting domain-containing protein [Flavobacterium bernardetii]NHF70637.1 T9SS type A sorting domain-containing protein [Flavobacterium bernardetii]
MKNTYLTLLFLFSAVGFSQYNPTAPWKNSTSNSKSTNFQNEVDAFNEYWKTHNKNIKGSGYKPFKRWESFYENQLNPDGTIVTPQQLWAAWEEKNNAKAYRTNSAMALPPSNWQPVGPFSHTNTGSWSSGQGRTSAVAVDPSNPNIIYVGSPAGGIWKSTNSGSTWTPLADQLPQIGVSGIAVDHTNSNTIFIAIGDKDASNTYSIGVLKSTDGGLNWGTTGLVFAGTGNQAGDLIMHPTNNQIILCATSAGLYKTIDGGTTWAVEQAGDFSQGSVRFKPNDPTVVYATTNNQFFKSTNTADTFTNITTGLSAAGSTSRMILDVTPADNNYVYVLSISNGGALNGLNGIYRSTNSGTSFTATQTTTDILESGQGGYDLALGVSDTNKDLVFTGCLNVWKSINGGTAVTKVNNWSSPTSATYTHADIHHLQYINGKLFCLSDGGIYASTNNGTSFTDLTAGLQIGQFYKISVSKTSSGKMVGGLQDNGGYAFSNAAWKNYYGADGMDTAVSQSNSNLYYGFIQNGSSMYISNNAGNGITGSVGSPGGLDGNWVTPLRGDSQGNMYSGFNGLYKLVTGGWVLQNTNSVGSTNLELISIDPSNDNIIYVANGSSLYKSINAGVTFSLASTAASTITSICVHSSNSNIVYITRSGTGGQAMISNNGGTTFTNIATGLPAIAKNCIVHQARNTDNPLYVATSLGVYYKDDTMTTWQPFDTNLPNVSVTDLEINLEDAKIIAATYGRGIWQTDIPIQIPATDVKFISVNNPTLNINCGASVTPQIVVKNGGTNAITSVTVNYTVDATPYTFNWSGNIAASQNQNIDLPAVTTTRGVHNLNFNITTTGDAYADNNTGTSTFYTNDTGVVGLVNTFTAASDELLVISDGAGWVRGNRTGDVLQTSGNPAYLTSLSGNYSDSSKSYLVSQCYNLSNVSNPQISFKLAYDLELNWDVAYVEYSTDLGATWSVLGTMGAGWYNSNRTPQTTGSDCNDCVGAQWTGTNTTFNTYSYGLSALNTQTNIIFRVVFIADGGVNQLGIKLDDFVISGVLSASAFEANQIAVFPNPSTGIFNIAFGNLNPNKIEVYDITGKLIMKKDSLEVSGNNQTNIDLSNTSNGVYFVKISTENNTITKRIIKN